MGDVTAAFTTEKAIMGKSTNKIIQFTKSKPIDVKPYIDLEKGWKFTEDDKEFLITYYEDYLKFCNEECGGDFSDEVSEILNSIKQNGVEKSKELIQGDALTEAGAFGYDVYKKYSDSPSILKLIENSILDIQW